MQRHNIKHTVAHINNQWWCLLPPVILVARNFFSKILDVCFKYSNKRKYDQLLKPICYSFSELQNAHSELVCTQQRAARGEPENSMKTQLFRKLVNRKLGLRFSGFFSFKVLDANQVDPWIFITVSLKTQIEPLVYDFCATNLSFIYSEFSEALSTDDHSVLLEIIPILLVLLSCHRLFFLFLCWLHAPLNVTLPPGLGIHHFSLPFFLHRIMPVPMTSDTPWDTGKFQMAGMGIHHFSLPFFLHGIMPVPMTSDTPWDMGKFQMSFLR